MRRAWVLVCVLVPSLLFAYNCQEILKAIFPDLDPVKMSPFMQRLYGLVDVTLTETSQKQGQQTPKSISVEWVDNMEDPDHPDALPLAAFLPKTRSFKAHVSLKNNLFAAPIFVHEWKHRTDMESGLIPKMLESVLWPLSPTLAIEAPAFAAQHAFLREVRKIESYSGEYLDELVANTQNLTAQAKTVFTEYLKLTTQAANLHDKDFNTRAIIKIATKLKIPEDSVIQDLTYAFKEIGYLVEDYFLADLNPNAYVHKITSSIPKYALSIRKERAIRTILLLLIAGPPAVGFWSYYCQKNLEDPICAPYRKNP